eukprot:999390-Pleurochrysis_carterae.AAC.1
MLPGPSRQSDQCPCFPVGHLMRSESHWSSQTTRAAPPWPVELSAPHPLAYARHRLRAPPGAARAFRCSL